MTEYFIPGVGYVSGAYRTADGVQRPANWLVLATPEQRAAEGAIAMPAVALGERIDKGAEGWVVRPMTGAERTELLTRRIAETKWEAGRRIQAVLPDWKQRNLSARAAELAEKGRADWTAEELAEWTAGAALWERIKAIRGASDAIEAVLAGMADAELDGFVVAGDSRWP